MAMVGAGIANAGAVMRPYLVQEIRAPDLTVLKTTEPEVFEQAMTEANAAALTEMMVGAVEQGTGSNARINGVSVAGKTGTAQTGNDRPSIAWFVAFAHRVRGENPRRRRPASRAPIRHAPRLEVRERRSNEPRVQVADANARVVDIRGLDLGREPRLRHQPRPARRTAREHDRLRGLGRKIAVRIERHAAQNTGSPRTSAPHAPLPASNSYRSDA